MGVIIESEDGTIVFAGSYNGFGSFRQEIAQVLDCPTYNTHVDLMVESMVPSEVRTIRDRIRLAEEAKQAKRRMDQELRNLYVTKSYAQTFLEHSDCDGFWTPQECQDVKRLLEEVKPKLKSVEILTTFVKGLEYGIRNQQNINFT